ncbi:MAG: YdbL family protein [Gammaproteobacteria bacterium]
MKTFMRGALLSLMTALSACVTVNVYFPAAAVEEAADRIVKEVYGAKVKEMQDQKSAPQESAPAPKDKSSTIDPAHAVGMLLEMMVTPAYAQQPNIDVDTPAINQLKGQMQTRHGQLVPFYNAGAIGLGANGLLELRDAKAVSLKDRGTVQELIKQENADRNALYGEIAKANDHPEWEPEIRTIFDRRWVANAPSGWWFQDAGGGWVQK